MSISSPGSQGGSITELVAARLAARSATAPRSAAPNVVPAGPALAARNVAAAAAAYGIERRPQPAPSSEQAVVVETNRGVAAQAPVQASSTDEELEQQASPGLTRPQVEELAQRYLRAIGKPERATDPQEVKKLADFYGANPERSERLNTLVAGLEGDGAATESGTVAVA